jgi:hypothetical protein
MKLYMLPVIISLLAAPYSANAGAWKDGNDLLRQCKEGEAGNGVSAGICLGYIVAVADTLDAANRINGFTARIANAVTQGQLKQIAMKYLQEHPEQLHLGAAGLVAAALSEAFP